MHNVRTCAHAELQYQQYASRGSSVCGENREFSVLKWKQNWAIQSVQRNVASLEKKKQSCLIVIHPVILLCKNRLSLKITSHVSDKRRHRAGFLRCLHYTQHTTTTRKYKDTIVVALLLRMTEWPTVAKIAKIKIIVSSSSCRSRSRGGT